MKNQFQISGTITEVTSIETFSSGFTKRAFTIENNDGQYTDVFRMELHKDKTNLVTSDNIGQHGIFHFNIRCREHNERYYTNLVAWKVELTSAEPEPEQQPVNEISNDNNGGDDDSLPF